MDKKKLLSSLQADLKASDLARRAQDAKVKQWKAEYDAELYGNEQNGKSKIVSRDIKKQSEWQHASILDPFVSSPSVVKASPVTFEDEKAARQSELLLNTQFCRQFDRYNFMSKTIKVLDKEGTVIIQTGWDYEEEKTKVKVPTIAIDMFGNEVVAGYEEVEQIKVVTNKPTAKVCRLEDVYIDPTCQDNVDEAQFIIYRYESDLSSLRKDGRYKNLDKIPVANINVFDDNSYISPDKTYFRFEDDPRKKMLVYEYWGNYDVNNDGIAEPIVCTWVNDTIIRLQSNPYPDKKPPFIIAPFNSVPFRIYGEANAELIGDNQKIKTAITRGIIDNMAQSNNGQKGIKKGALDVSNRKKFLAGQHFEFNNAASDFWDGSYNQIPSSAFDMLAMQNNEIESLTGVKSFSGGINASSLGATATGARGAMDATSTRKLNIVRNISENVVKPLLRKWLAYDLEFMSDEEVVRVTNEQYVTIRRDDLEGKIDIDIEVTTAEDNAAKAQELSFLLQTVGPNEDPAVRRAIMSDILELMKMPDKAKRLREYQPQADPMQQKMQQLQLQLLEAQVANERAKAAENEVDSRKKTAEAILKEAMAQKVLSEKDQLDLEFLRKDSGVDSQTDLEKLRMSFQKELQMAEMKHQSEMMKLQHKSNTELTKQDLADFNRLREKLQLMQFDKD